MPNIKQVLVGAAAVTLGVSFVAAVVSPNTDDSTSSSQETSEPGTSDELDKKGYKPCGICEPW